LKEVDEFIDIVFAVDDLIASETNITSPEL